ncbi:hypothetical protein C5167_027865 [Papaver somniferum]|nr:hypothetical protein C5167_027865 [Papaver somniferum]
MASSAENISNLPSLKNVTSLVSIKLDKSNHLLWKSQMLPLLHSQDLYQIVDPKIPLPKSTLTDPTTNEETENPIYTQWHKTDQLLLSWINATLTEPILAQVVGKTTARDSRLVLHFPPSLELYALLLQQEIRVEHDNLHRLPPENNAAAFVARQFNPYRNNNNNSNQRAGRSYQHPANGRGRGNGSSGRGRSFNQHPASSSRSILSAPPTDKPVRVSCQVCNKPGHTALQCHNRFNQAYQPNDLPQSFAAMQLASTPYDQHWYPDTGATNHMTAEFSEMDNRIDYNGQANGEAAASRAE